MLRKEAQVNCFDTALTNLATDVNDPDITVEQVIHTAMCIRDAYGPTAVAIVELAVAEAQLRRWVPDMTKKWWH